MIIDSHCHLDFPDFEGELDAVLARAAEAGVGGAITICTRVRRFDQVHALTEGRANVACTVGTHPHNAGEESDVPLAELLELSQRDGVVGIGEAGLDYHYDHAPRDVQAEVFRTHIAAARETGLPLVIHARSADEDVAAILADEHGRGAFPFVLHCFSSGADLARTGVALGGYVSFSGILTFKRSDELREIARQLPSDRILVETDAPYLAPVPHRGKRNEPAYTRHTAATLARVRELEEDALFALTRENTLRLFSRLPDGFGTLA